MSSQRTVVLRNPQAIDEGSVPVLEIEPFRTEVLTAVGYGARLIALFGRTMQDHAVKVYALLAHDETGECHLLATLVRDRYPALTPECPQAHWFERELAEQFAVEPEGHPWLKPIRHHADDRGVAAGPTHNLPAPMPGAYPFFQVSGDEVHEVAVGPVHAGIIEPGHFRFQCHGERVLHLEIQLGYQHRGLERLLEGPLAARTTVLAESIAGDTVIGHALACCEAAEALMESQVSPRAQLLRGIALELERLANHVGDLGALSADVAFLPGAAYFGRLRGEFLNLLMELTGSRYGRSFLQPGGVSCNLDQALTAAFVTRLTRARKDLGACATLFFDTPSVADRVEQTGVVTKQASDELGFVGPTARASGSARDVRHDHPSGIYRFTHLPVVTASTGDVYARALVRWLESEQSLEFLLEQIDNLPEGALHVPMQRLLPNHVAFAMTEGWRGEILHVVFTDAHGQMTRYKVIDPSCHNWMAVALALRNGEISDFPLCNKSFNLSYAGHDL